MIQSTHTSPSLLDIYPVGKTRRNHGLEHATLHVLARRHPHTSLAGHSDAGGFWIIGNVSTEEVHSAALDARQRLLDGQSQLTIHPHCGTNFVAAGTLAGLAGALAMSGVGARRRDKLERLPLAISLATLALIAAQPLGALLQARLTTSADVFGLEVVEVTTSRRGKMRAHRVKTRVAG
jgi:hypothetical protein